MKVINFAGQLTAAVGLPTLRFGRWVHSIKTGVSILLVGCSLFALPVDLAGLKWAALSV